MKTKIKYQAKDGSEWDAEDAALKREMLLDDIAAAMKPLGDTPEEVTSGKGWVQHDPENVVKAKQMFLNICLRRGLGDRWSVFKEPAEKVHSLCVIGRILDDPHDPLGYAWGRFGRIDEQGREHQQQYYAYTAGPDPKHICIEDRRMNANSHTS